MVIVLSIPGFRAKRRLAGVLCCSALLLTTAMVQAEPLTDIRDLGDVKDEFAKLKTVETKNHKWFETGSNYGRLFLERDGVGQIVRWLGSLSPEYRPSDFNGGPENSQFSAKALYRSNRNESAPVSMTFLIPHPRAISSRQMDLLPAFNDLKKRIASSETVEKMTIAGYPAELGFHSEEQKCGLLISLPRLSMLYFESADCPDGKKLVRFCDTIDIRHLGEKLEK